MPEPSSDITFVLQDLRVLVEACGLLLREPKNSTIHPPRRYQNHFACVEGLHLLGDIAPIRAVSADLGWAALAIALEECWQTIRVHD